LYNENYVMPPLPEGASGDVMRRGIVEGLYRFVGPAETGGARRATLCFSGPMWRAAMDARQLLADGWGVSVDAWSATSWTHLRTDAVEAERWSRLHPHEPARTPFVADALGTGRGPVVAVTDYMRAVPDQVARWVPRPFVSLGTDGFGHSDARQALRRYFEVDAAHVVVAVLAALARTGEADPAEVQAAIDRFGIDVTSAPPFAL